MYKDAKLQSGSSDTAYLLISLATSTSVLVIARVLQGFAAAFVWTAGPMYLSGRLGPEQMVTALGWTTLGGSVGKVMNWASIRPAIEASPYHAHQTHYSALNTRN